MTDRQLAAYLLVAEIAFAFLIGWRIARLRRRRHRHAGHSRIDLVRGAKSPHAERVVIDPQKAATVDSEQGLITPQMPDQMAQDVKNIGGGNN